MPFKFIILLCSLLTIPPALADYDLWTMKKLDKITCADVLSYVSIYPMPSDPDVNRIFNVCFAYCLTRLMLQYRLYTLPNDAPEKIRTELARLEKLLGPMLRILKISFIIFSPPSSLRAKLEAQSQERYLRYGMPFQED